MQIILFTDVADTIGYGKYAGTYKLATELRSNGYSCQVIDNFSYYSWGQLTSLATKFISSDTVLVGFSCTLSEKRINGKVYNFGMEDERFMDFLQFIKNINPNTKVALGGARMNNMCHWKGVDFVVLNKADRAIIAILEHLLYSKELIVQRHTPSKLVDGNDYPYSQDDFSTSQIIFEPHDIIFPNEALPIEVSRGCIFACAFCRYDHIGKKIGEWQKNATTLRNEFLRNYEMYGTTNYMFSDELINESLDKMQFLCDVVSSLPFKLQYTSYARIDLIWRYPEMRELLLQSGAISLQFGIETLNEQVGKKIGKGLATQKIKDTITYCSELWRGKIIMASNFIVGLPNEDENSIWRTVDYLVSDECKLDVFGFLPLAIKVEDDGRKASKIDLDPKKFGYEIVATNDWDNGHMKYADARRLVSKIWQDSRVQKKAKFGAATWIGRVINLGYTIEHIFDLLDNTTHTYKSCKKLFIDSSNNKKLEYYNKLMELK